MLKLLLAIGVLFVAVWFSFDTEPLSVRHEREAMKQYKPEQLVEKYMKDSVAELTETALPLSRFVNDLHTDAKTLQEQEGHILGIGSNIYYVVKGESNDVSFANNEFVFTSDGVKCHLPLKYIFGNIAREASGWFDVGEFRNITDFNLVSACINKYIKEKVVGPFAAKAETYKSCSFCAAVEVEPGQTEVKEVILYPYSLTMSNE